MSPSVMSLQTLYSTPHRKWNSSCWNDSSWYPWQLFTFTQCCAEHKQCRVSQFWL